jgi:DNA-directed RNA polymerase specialized sigma24 family protein
VKATSRDAYGSQVLGNGGGIKVSWETPQARCRLDSCGHFYFDSYVSPAEDDVTSLSAIGGNAYPGPAAFTTTHWSVVLTAQGESPAAQEALETLCRTYWRPVFAFLRRQGVPLAEAEDITQGFFAQLLERRRFNTLRKEKGRLRSFLLGALKYFVAHEERRAMAIKRGKGRRLISLEELRAAEHVEVEPSDPVNAEVIYERRWAMTVLERGLVTESQIDGGEVAGGSCNELSSKF